MAWAPHKEKLGEAFHVEIFPPASHRKPVQSSCHPAVSTPSQPPHSSIMDIITASLLPPWGGTRCPHSCVPTVQEAGAAASLSPQAASRKFALQVTVAAFQLNVGTQP